jgi:hypothetical protein
MNTATKPELEWHEAPVKTTWGAGMVAADIELSRDETMTIYVHEDAIPLVAAALRKLAKG